jgi:NAD(P)H-hydrate epimerase
MPRPFRLVDPTCPYLTVAACRELDRVASEQWGMPGLLLMEHAGRGAAEWIWELLAASLVDRAGDVLCLAGPGNNGGDALVVARLLLGKRLAVRVLLATQPTGLPSASDASLNLALARACGVPIELADLETLQAECAAARLVVDGLLGSGLKGAPRAPFAAMIEAVNASAAPVLALDLPSGLDGDSGAAPGSTIRARWTATFAAPKLGLQRGVGPAHVGQVAVIDIGLPPAAYQAVGANS